MRTFTIEAHIDGQPYSAIACVSTEPYTVYLHTEVFCEWNDTDKWSPLWSVDESIEDLYDAAFLEACQQEEEDKDEAIEASETGF
jgi:hypothetical protein